MEVCGWVEMLLLGGIVGMDAVMVEGGREEEREENGDRPG